MRLLHTSIVGEDETDHLGHMNVRFYMERVERANSVLMAELGLDLNATTAKGLGLFRMDSYCKYNREQFPGATLQVRGGVLDVSHDSAQMFYEVRNPDQDVHAGTFIIEYALMERATHTRAPLPEGALRRAEGERIGLPEHGAPRSIKLVPPRTDVRFDEIRARVGDGGDSMMGALMEREVEPEDCDEFGFIRPGEDLMFGSRQRARLLAEEGRRPGPKVNVSASGVRFGWAWMETRALVFETPRAGDRLRSIGADVALGRKTRQSRRWIFDIVTGRLIATDDMVGIALDLDARRSIEIPPDVRRDLAPLFVPEFA